jgi:D-threo-aldose 1-dehydrogenase
VRIPELGFGGGPLGGLFEPLNDATAAAALSAGWDGGIRYYDTSPHYGIGHSERRMGEMLRGRPPGDFTVSTKVGRLLVPQDPAGREDEAFAVPATHRRVWDFSLDGVRRSVEDSLERMGLDRIDILYLHDAEQHFDDALRLGYPALAQLRDEGIVEAIGAGMYDVDQLTTLVRETAVDVVMLAGGYTLLQQPALDTFLPACEENGVAVVAAGVFNSGILAMSRPDPDAKFDYQTATPDVLQRARRLAEICESYGVTLPQAAMAFPLRHPAVTSVVLGMRTAAEVQQNLAAFSAEIPEELWAELAAA